MKTLEFGIIGLGHFGRHYVRLLTDFPGAHLKMAANNPVETELLLKDPTIDCVIIASPLTSHFDLVHKSLVCGKHVLVEKPMTTNLKEAEFLRNASQINGKTLMAGYQYLYNDFIIKLKEYIENKSLGKIVYLFAEHLYFGPLRKDSGVFFDAAPHELSIIDFLFGPLDIIDVIGRATNFSQSQHDDFVSCEVVFTGNLIFTLVLSRFSPQKVRRMTVGGENGLAIFDDLEQKDKLKLFLKSYPTQPNFNSKSSLFLNNPNDNIYIPDINAREPLLQELKHFIECVRESKPPRTGADHSIRIAQQLEKIYGSMRHVKVN